MRPPVTLTLLVLLSACASSGPRLGPNLAAASRHPGLTCAPYARALSGIELRGDAAEWWDAAYGRYRRSNFPEVGSVLVFRRSDRLPSGHVSVVSRLIGSRQIHVIQANWVPGELDQDQLVVDVSEQGDWTAVRVWWPMTGTLGSHTYETYGFVHPDRPTTHEVLLRTAEPAARWAGG